MPGDEGFPSSLIENRSVDVGDKFLQRATTSSSQTICADSERREEAGPETVSHRVEHRELESAVVRGEVEGITGDVECRLQTARDMHTAVSIGRQGSRSHCIIAASRRWPAPLEISKTSLCRLAPTIAAPIKAPSAAAYEDISGSCAFTPSPMIPMLSLLWDTGSQRIGPPERRPRPRRRCGSETRGPERSPECGSNPSEED